MTQETKHTPEPWSQGTTLTTRTTSRWTEEQLKESDRQEKLRVFANFKHDDEGRSRILVAVCERAEDARLIAAAPELLEVLERAQPWITDFLDVELTKDISAVISKAKGGAA